MKWLTCLILLLGLSSSAAFGAPAAREKFVLVRLTDHADVQSYAVMSAATLKETEALYAKEARVHARALALAEKDWRNDESVGKSAFPRSAASVRTATVVGRPFDSESEATAELADRENRNREDARRKADRDKQLKKKQKRDTPPADFKREGEQAKARELYAVRLRELLTAAETPAANPAPPAGEEQPQ